MENSNSFLSTRKPEGCGDFCFHFDWLATHHVRAIAPLLDGIDCSLDQQRVSAEDLQVLNRPFFGNDRAHDYITLNVRLPCEHRIWRFDFVDDHAFDHTLRDANSFGGDGSQFRYCRDIRSRTDDSAD